MPQSPKLYLEVESFSHYSLKGPLILVSFSAPSTIPFPLSFFRGRNSCSERLREQLKPEPAKPFSSSNFLADLLNDSAPLSHLEKLYRKDILWFEGCSLAPF